MNNWISVKDRLPNKEGDYLVCITDYLGKTRIEVEMLVEWANCFNWLGYMSTHWKDCNTITHWMPLPEPPTGNDELTLMDNNVMMWTDGVNFICSCGGNVFTKYKTSNNKIIYECHSCNTHYEGE